jgi:hypothetical protein
MTRKDYKLLARALWGSAFVNDSMMTAVELDYAKQQWLTTVRHIADALAKDSPRFDRSTFETACREGV